VYSHGEDTIGIETSRWKQPLMARALSQAAYVFANSEFTRERLVRTGAAREAVEILYPSIDASRYTGVTDDEGQAFLASLGLAGRQVILTVARFQARKGHDTVVRALPAIAARVPDVQYLVVGKGDASEVSRLAASLGVSERVTIVHSLSDEDLARAYRGCRLYVMPSRADASGEVEGFGMVYLEAAAAGRPSVSGNAGGAPEAVVDGVTGVTVDPESAEATAEAVIGLLSDPSRRERMGVAARERVLARFDDRVFLARLKDACAAAARQPRRGDALA
jgi:phosphatidyl-myo-inositol dimannoside synthase